MAENLQNQIMAWGSTGPYWFQHLAYKIITNNNVDDSLINEVYDYFLEDCNLKNKEIGRPDIQFTLSQDTINSSTNQNLKLKSIKDIEFVNALAKGQTIDINSNLTIVYGANGSGKSGYVRLLNKVFNSRGDKVILPNVESEETSGEPTCFFTFNNDGSEYHLKFPDNQNSIEFSKFSVFDTQSINVHLEGDNKLNFTPIGFEFFEYMMDAYSSIKSKLDNDISANQPANTFLTLFKNENEIKAFISTLGHYSKKETLEVLSKFDNEESELMNVLSSRIDYLNSLNIATKIAEINGHKSQLKLFKDRTQKYIDLFNTINFPIYKKLIDDLNEFKILANIEGIEALKEFNIDNIDTIEWKAFIQAAKRLADFDKKITTYPTDTDTCLFCLQPLEEPQKELIEKYWTILKSQAQQNIERCERESIQIQKTLTDLENILFDINHTLYDYINTIDPKLAKKWSLIINELIKIKKGLIGNLLENKWTNLLVCITPDLKDFKPIDEIIEKTIKELYELDPGKEIIEINSKLDLLKDKYLLNKMKSDISSFIDKHKWALLASHQISSLSTRSITIKQGQLFNQHITRSYTQKFIEESNLLGAPEIVSISQRNQTGNTLRTLEILGHKANLVLSEGEQRAVSLADFLTEVQLNPNKTGVIFDDPVTSLDHERRERIAERLVNYALTHQVIIFTHDISFYLRLLFISRRNNVGCSTTTMRKIQSVPGVIKPDLPWIAQDVKARLGYLRNSLVELKKLEKDDETDKYPFAVKAWYELLREGWERFVEERIFQGVIERFMPSVQTQKLKKITINEEIIKEIEIAMTDSSAWVHDSAAILHPTIPITSKVEEHLNIFDEFVKKYPIK